MAKHPRPVLAPLLKYSVVLIYYHLFIHLSANAKIWTVSTLAVLNNFK